MSVVKWSPMFPRWGRFFEDLELPEFDLDFGRVGGLDVFEEGSNVVVRANVPGVPEDKIDVTVEDGVVTVSGKVEKKEEDKKKYYRKESKSSFNYSTSIPVKGEWGRAEAEIKDGVVTVTIPKSKEAKPKRIKIKKG